jgi:hypothetical protein
LLATQVLKLRQDVAHQIEPIRAQIESKMGKLEASQADALKTPASDVLSWLSSLQMNLTTDTSVEGFDVTAFVQLVDYLHFVGDDLSLVDYIKEVNEVLSHQPEINQVVKCRSQQCEAIDGVAAAVHEVVEQIGHSAMPSVCDFYRKGCVRDLLAHMKAILLVEMAAKCRDVGKTSSSSSTHWPHFNSRKLKVFFC